MSETEPESKDVTMRLALAVMSMRREGKSDGEIENALAAAGLEPALAQKFVAAVPSASSQSFQRAETDASERASKDIMLGLVFLLIGIVITAATYSAASKGGGHYVVMTGLIAVGLFRLIRGLVRR